MAIIFLRKQMWQVNGRKSEPFQTQDISGRAINS